MQQKRISSKLPSKPLGSRDVVLQDNKPTACDAATPLSFYLISTLPRVPCCPMGSGSSQPAELFSQSGTGAARVLLAVCEVCERSAAVLQCGQCQGDLFCSACDVTTHSWPGKNDHTRATWPPENADPCDRCNDQAALFLCGHCGFLRFCRHCDSLVHEHQPNRAHRLEHLRTRLGASPALTANSRRTSTPRHTAPIKISIPTPTSASAFIISIPVGKRPGASYSAKGLSDAEQQQGAQPVGEETTGAGRRASETSGSGEGRQQQQQPVGEETTGAGRRVSETSGSGEGRQQQQQLWNEEDKGQHVPAVEATLSRENTEAKSEGEPNKLPGLATAEQSSAQRKSPPDPVNPGRLGDVVVLNEPDAKGALDMEELVFRNTFNPFDVIGQLQIVQVCVGDKHAAAVSQYGSLFTWGSNNEGQLGVALGNEKECSEPQLVQFPESVTKPVRMAACGYVHMAVLCQDGDVYTWGSGMMGILGHVADDNQEFPKRVNFEVPSVENTGGLDDGEVKVWIACGQSNTAVVVRGRQDGQQWYVWGANNMGQMGNGTTTPCITPTLCTVEDDDNSRPVVIQLEFGAAHACCLTLEGYVYSWGQNNFGQCGCLERDDGLPQTVPLRIRNLTGAIQIACGERHSSCLTRGGIVKCLGKRRDAPARDHGQ